MSNYPTSKVVSYGLLGGFTGAIVMGAIAYAMPIPNTGGAPFFVAAAIIMGLGTLAWTAGWVMHLVTGLIVGAVFATLVTKVSRIQPKTKGRATGLGLLAGVVVWAVFFVPLMATLMPALMSMTTLVAGSFVAHAIYGLVLGGITSVALPKSALLKCETCGATFATEEELKEHEETHMTKAESFKCQACRATFGSQQLLEEHIREAHPMAISR